MSQTYVLKILGVAVLIFVSTACGRKGDPIPPEFLHPGAVLSLTGQRDGAGVLLQWNAPGKTAGGKALADLDHFIVKRRPAVTEDSEAEEYQNISQVELTGKTYDEKIQAIYSYRDTGAAAGGDYEYLVVAVDTEGNEAMPGNVVLVKPVGG